MTPYYNYQEYQGTAPQFCKHVGLQGSICPDILGNTLALKGEAGFDQA